MPEFESGDYVQYITQSNFIVQYRILQKQALEFEEVDEDAEVPAPAAENQDGAENAEAQEDTQEVQAE